MKKGLYYQTWPRHAKAITTWNSIDFAIHSHKRRVLNHAFSSKALRSAEPFVLSNADRWCELLDHEVSAGGEWSGSVNMTDWVNYLVFDILGVSTILFFFFCSSVVFWNGLERINFGPVAGD